MNKTKKKWNFHATKKYFSYERGLRYFLKQSMMRGNEYPFVRNYPLLEYVLSVFDSL